jgi:uncharacterized membrane protein
MSAEILAVLGAFTFSLFYLFSRMAVQWSSPFSVNLWTNGMCAVLLSLVLPFLSTPAAPSAKGLTYLVLAGMASPSLAALFIIFGARRIGISRTSGVVGLAPLLASSFAILYLGEKPSWRIAAGTILIVLGVMTLSFEKTDLGWTWQYLGFPLLGALCLGLTAIFRKLALLDLPAPLFGAAVQTWAGVLFLILLSPLIPRNERFQWKLPAFRHIALAGIFITLSLSFYFTALDIGEVTIVAPLVHSWPLFVTLMSRVFIQSLEQVSWQSAGGTVLVICGGYLVVS